MNVGEWIAVVAIVLIVGLAVAYLIRAKKRGQTCVGCPYASTCTKGKCGCAPSGEDDQT